MPIKIPDKLPATQQLRKENIFVMSETKAMHQDIRPLKIVIVNLMPTKITTETQLLRLLSNSPLQVEIDFLQMESHSSKNTSTEHLKTFYKSFDEIKDWRYDGMIITGAPVENMPFEEVDYWSEIVKIMDWSTTHVTSTLHICWGALAGLYYHYGRRAASDVGCSAYQDPVCPPVDFFRRIGNDGLWLAGGYGRTAGPPQKQGDQYQR